MSSAMRSVPDLKIIQRYRKQYQKNSYHHHTPECPYHCALTTWLTGLMQISQYTTAYTASPGVRRISSCLFWSIPFRRPIFLSSDGLMKTHFLATLDVHVLHVLQPSKYGVVLNTPQFCPHAHLSIHRSVSCFLKTYNRKARKVTKIWEQDSLFNAQLLLHV